jgi:hypothetical protein
MIGNGVAKVKFEWFDAMEGSEGQGAVLAEETVEYRTDGGVTGAGVNRDAAIDGAGPTFLKQQEQA